MTTINPDDKLAATAILEPYTLSPKHNESAWEALRNSIAIAIAAARAEGRAENIDLLARKTKEPK